MTIGEVARRSGLKPSAIRYYEDVALLPKPARSRGRRVYGAGVFHRLALIEFAKRSGFTLAEIRLLAGAGPGSGTISARWKALAARKLKELERSEQEIALMRQLLQQAIRCRCLDVEECGRAILSKQYTSIGG